MYLHYHLLARPDFLVAQGLLTNMRSVMFLVGTGGVSIWQLKVNWEDKDLHKLIYVFIYRLYDPSHFADPSYVRTGDTLQHRLYTYSDRSGGDRAEQTPMTESVGGIPLSSQTRSRDTRNAPNEAPP